MSRRREVESLQEWKEVFAHQHNWDRKRLKMGKKQKAALFIKCWWLKLLYIFIIISHRLQNRDCRSSQNTQIIPKHQKKKLLVCASLDLKAAHLFIFKTLWFQLQWIKGLKVKPLEVLRNRSAEWPSPVGPAVISHTATVWHEGRETMTKTRTTLSLSLYLYLITSPLSAGQQKK